MKVLAELLIQKRVFLSRITVYGIDIAAAKENKSIDCQNIRTEKRYDVLSADMWVTT